MIEIRPHDDGKQGGERDSDGVRVISHGAAAGATRVWQGVGLLLASACAGYLLMPTPVASRPTVDAKKIEANQLNEQIAEAMAQEEKTGANVAVPGAAAAKAAPGAAPTVSTRPLTPRRAGSHRAGDKPPEDEDPGELPIPADRLKDVTMGEYIQALHDAGIYEGIGAFNPPGTSPPLEGIFVPEDYILPEGYVRHFQSTDDGQPIDPILMYSPDYEFLDEHGNPIEIPANRVVPPEHAPPGLTPRIVQIPQPREPGDTAR
jgi:hypothetical protein